MEIIAEVQAEEKRQTEAEPPAWSVPDAVADRALTSGGNGKHSIERIVAFFQRSPSNEDAAAFLAKEYGVGGKGLTIAKKQYAMWFDERGIHICPGNNTYGTIFTHLPWPAVAVRISQLLRGGMFASQEKIDAAPENELDELANSLANLRADFSDAAKEKDYLHTISEAYGRSRSEESVLRIKELLREPESRRRVLSELRAFTSFYTTDRSLLELRPPMSLPTLTRRIASLDKPITEFKAVDGFAPARATFITEDEIDQFLMEGPHVQDSKIRIYSYFMRGHDAKECAAFLRREYGDIGGVSEGRQIWSDGKGLKLTRSDDVSGFSGYATTHLNWNQAQKRVRELIEKDRFLTQKERESLPEHDKDHTARMVYQFFSHLPNCQHRPYTEGADAVEGAKQIRLLLETPGGAERLFSTMLADSGPIGPDADGYEAITFALRDMGAYVRGDSPLFTPLPEKALQAEREVIARYRQKNRAAEKSAAADTAEAPETASSELAAVARALASKRKPVAEAQNDGQFSLFSAGQTAEPQEQREITDADLDAFLIEDLGDPDRKLRLYALFTGDWSDAMVVRKLEQEYSRSRRGNLEGGFCTLADGTRGYAYFTKELRLSPRPEGVMRHISFEEMAQHIRQLIQEGRYLSPEELERYQKDHPAPEPEQESSRSPWWDEYTALKADIPDRLLLYQIGDFYELFGEDAKNAAAVLDLPLTTRPIGGMGRVEMCGIPLPALQRSIETLGGQYPVALSIIDAKTGERQTRALTSFDSDTGPYNFEFEYRLLSRLKADCEYYLGAGNRAQKHLAQGSVEAQIARMRELYDLLPEKPEWLTAEDIDRYEAQMTGAEPEKQATRQDEAPAGESSTVDQTGTYEAAVTTEEAPLLARLLENAGITPEQSDNGNGGVSFRVPEAQKDALDQMITKLRAEISKSVAATYKPKKARRTRPEVNYRAFAKLFPEIINGEYRSMRFQAGPSYMPLHVQWIADDTIALSHTTRQNGDTLYDPEMTFRVDREKGTLEALTFQQDVGLPIYQEVYPEPGKWVPKLRGDLNNFAAQWMKNITEQRFIREKAVAERDGEDMEVFFSPEGTATPAYDLLMREADAITAQLLNDEHYTNARMNSDEQNSRDEFYSAMSRIVVSMAEANPQFYKVYFDAPLAVQQFRDHLFETTYRQDMTQEQTAPPAPANAVTLYREALSALGSAVRQSSFYDYLRDRETDYDSAQTELDAEIAAMMDEIRADNPALHEAYHTLPKFREWLIEDILEQTYQDIPDPNDAVRRYADAPDAPAWIQEVSALEHSEQEQPEAGTETPPTPEAESKPTGAGAPENTETVWRSPGGKEYRAGDAVGYVVDGKRHEFIIDSIGKDYIYYTFSDLAQAPVEMFRDRFEGHLDDGSFTVLHKANERSQEPPAVGRPEGNGDSVPVERDFTPNVEEYFNLKAQHPDKLIVSFQNS